MSLPDTPRRIRVLTVDDHPVLRDGVAAIIQLQDDMELVGEAADGAQGVEAFRRLRPDVTLMDLQMPVLSGLEAIRQIRAQAPAARIVVLTTYAGDVQAVRALKAGAAGFLLKAGLRKELLDAIRAAHAGRRHVPGAVAAEIAEHAGDDQLTDREVSVLSHVAAGEANKEIARSLGLAEDTIKAHLKSIFVKLGVSDRTHAVTVAARRGFIVL
jgi:DNA-binding NarL/FixJ family response regulator